MMRALSCLFLLLAAGCARGLSIDHSLKARSQDSRVQFIILHFTSEKWEDSVRILTQGDVSAHYLVRDAPVTIYQLVPEDRRAYQAGVSSWQGQTQLNAASVGIEIQNLGDVQGPGGLTFHPFPEAQVDAVIRLVKDIQARHHVRPDRILGHSDIAPLRKVDPGPTFPWKRLADAGLIPWPDAGAVAARRTAFEAALPGAAWFQEKLAKHGFAIERTGTLDAPTRRILAAFQMKYRPARWDGEPDAETAALLDVLTS
jgi:N-acetylmuramoyl-L-alanine amidase